MAICERNIGKNSKESFEMDGHHKVGISGINLLHLEHKQLAENGDKMT